MASTSSPVSAAGATPSSATGSPATEGVLPTVTNFQATAGQNIANAGATALAQIAAAGSKGQAAIQQAQAQNAAAKTAAIQSAMATSALHGGGQQFGQNTAMLATTPLTSAAGTLSNLGANYAAENQGLQAANSNYFAGLQGALPIDAAAIQQDILNDQSKNASAATAANLSLNTKQLANELALAKLGTLNSPTGGDVSTFLTKTFGSPQLAGQAFNADATGLESPGSPGVPGAPATAATGGSTGGLPGGMPNLAGGGGAPVIQPGVKAAPGTAAIPATPAVSQAQAYGAIDAKYGLPPGTAQNIANTSEQASYNKGQTQIRSTISTANAEFKAQNPSVTNAAFVQQVQNLPGYAPALEHAQALATANNNEAQIQQNLISQGVSAKAAAVIADQAWKSVNNTGTP